MSVSALSSAPSATNYFEKPDVKAAPETAQQIVADGIKASTQAETALKGSETDSASSLTDESKKIISGQEGTLHANPIPTVNGSGQRVGSYLNVVA